MSARLIISLSLHATKYNFMSSFLIIFTIYQSRTVLVRLWSSRFRSSQFRRNPGSNLWGLNLRAYIYSPTRIDHTTYVTAMYGVYIYNTSYENYINFRIQQIVIQVEHLGCYFVHEIFSEAKVQDFS